MELQGWVAALKIGTTVVFFLFFLGVLLWTLTRDRDRQEGHRMLVFSDSPDFSAEETDG